MLEIFFTWPTKCALISQSGSSFHATMGADRMAHEQEFHLAAAIDQHRVGMVLMNL
jgi:hypothetical protein